MFKVGDKVRVRVRRDSVSFPYGWECTVVSCYGPADQTRILVDKDAIGSTTNGWLAEFFELVRPKPKVKPLP